MKKLLPALLVASFLLSACGRSSSPAPVSNRTFASDTDFAREALTLLTNGDESVEGMLDWENFRVADEQVGAQYKSIPTDEGKAGFRKAFITSFSESFKATGASLDRVEKWQEAGKEGDNTKVAVSIPGAQGITLTVTHRDGHQRLAAIDTLK